MDAASRDPDITYVTTRHEEAAGHMAHAISRVDRPCHGCGFPRPGHHLRHHAA
jgi:hypothetical protein